MVSMAGTGTGIRGGGARQMVKAALEGAGGPAPLCQQAVTGRYPFTRGTSQGIPLDDFAKLFAPGGLIDGFVNSQLRPYIDMSGRPWRAQTVDGVAPIKDGELPPFQRASEIRDLFFGAGGTTPTVRFDITPVSLDDGAKQVTLDLGGTTVSYAHGPTRATQITWPGATGMQDVRLVFDPPPSGGTGALQESGPWALFRLFDQGRLQQQGAAERYVLTFQLGERQAAFEIRAGSVRNPFAPGTLSGFHCPSLQ
jgi:type VI secretion system protein ImpL